MTPEQTCVSLTTFRRSGEPVATPVGVVILGDGRLGVTTATAGGTVARLRHDPSVLVQACDLRGHVRPGSTAYAGTVEVVRSGGFFEETLGRMRARHRVLSPVVRLLRPPGRRDRAVLLVRLDRTTATPLTPPPTPTPTRQANND